MNSKINLKNRNQQGFTLIELMIVVAIIGILAAIAVPQYQNYTIKSRYSEVMSAANAYKTAVELCITNLGTVTGCSAGANEIPAALAAARGQVATIAVADGVITVTPVASNGIAAADTLILTPTLTNGIVTWAKTGGCTTRANGAIC